MRCQHKPRRGKDLVTDVSGTQYPLFSCVLCGCDVSVKLNCENQGLTFHTVLADGVATVRQHPWHGVLSVIAFHEKAGRSQVGSFVFLLDKLFSPSRAAAVATLPSALLVSDFVRSVQVGCSRFSRCCHLLVDLWSISRWKLGQAINAVTGTRSLGFLCFLSMNLNLCGYRHPDRTAIPQRFVSLSAHPQTVQQDR